MVLIISRASDRSTNHVMDWLNYKGKECYRINSESLFDIDSLITVELSSTKRILKIKLNEHTEIDLNKIDSIWYRKGEINPVPSLFEIKNGALQFEIEHEKLRENIFEHLQIENKRSKDLVYGYLQDGKKILGNFQNTSVNKIEVLTSAKRHGIDIPATLLTNTKHCLISFRNNYKNIITKAIQEGFNFNNSHLVKQEMYSSYTEELTDERMEKIPDTFFFCFSGKTR